MEVALKNPTLATEEYRYGIHNLYLPYLETHGEWFGKRLQELIGTYCERGAIDKVSAADLLAERFGYRPRISADRQFPQIIEASTLNQRISSLKNGSFNNYRQLKFYFHFLRLLLQEENAVQVPNSIGDLFYAKDEHNRQFSLILNRQDKLQIVSAVQPQNKNDQAGSKAEASPSPKVESKLKKTGVWYIAGAIVVLMVLGFTIVTTKWPLSFNTLEDPIDDEAQPVALTLTSQEINTVNEYGDTNIINQQIFNNLPPAVEDSNKTEEGEKGDLPKTADLKVGDSASTTQSKSIAGCWKWSNGGIIELLPNHSINNLHITGTWHHEFDNRFRIDWMKFIDTMRLENEGQTLTGINNFLAPLVGTRLTGSKSQIVGTWQWGNQVAEFKSNQIAMLSGLPTGKWRQTDYGAIEISWDMFLSDDIEKIDEDNLLISNYIKFPINQSGQPAKIPLGKITAKRHSSCVGQ